MISIFLNPNIHITVLLDSVVDTTGLEYQTALLFLGRSVIIRFFQFYLNYMIATSSEWVMALTMAAFILTFVAELRYAYAHAPRVVFRRDADDNPALGEPC